MSNEKESTNSQADSDLIDEVLDQAVDIENSENENNKEVETDINTEVEALQKQLNLAEQKAQDNWDKALRIQAEMENLKRRTQKDLENAHKYGLEKFSRELLSVIDSLELGIQASNAKEADIAKLREGNELTLKQFESVFAKFEIEAIGAEGDSFNPEHHQAMSMQPSADVPANTVLNIFQKGYILNGRLIRPAMVVVSQAVKSDDSTNLDVQA